MRVVSIVFDVVTPYEEDRVEDLGFRGLPRLIKDFGLAALGFTQFTRPQGKHAAFRVQGLWALSLLEMRTAPVRPDTAKPVPNGASMCRLVLSSCS